MSWTLISHTAQANAGTTTGINTTGANLLVVVVGSGGAGTSFSDSYSNTWSTADSNATTDGSAALYYCYNPTVGTGHTFSLGIGYGGVCFAAFSGSASSPLDQHLASNTSDLSVLTYQPGSVTPTTAGQLIISGLSIGKTSTAISIDSGFTIIDTAQGTSGSTYGASLAYLVQTTAAAANPTWTRDQSGDCWGVNVSFKVAGGVVTPPPALMMMGMG